MQTITRTAMAVWISFCFFCVLGLGACASSDSKDKVFGQTMPTIQQVYSEKMQHKPATGRESVQRLIHHKTGDLRGNLQSTHDELTRQFPRLPNPELMLYVYPHLTAAGTPVPGYYTVFPFYTQDQYALPGEITDSMIAEGNQ